MALHSADVTRGTPSDDDDEDDDVVDHQPLFVCRLSTATICSTQHVYNMRHHHGTINNIDDPIINRSACGACVGLSECAAPAMRDWQT